MVCNLHIIIKFKSVWSTYQCCSVCQSAWTCKTIHKVEYDADQLVLVCPESIRPGSLQGTRLTTRDNTGVNIVSLQSRSLCDRSVWRHKDGEHEVPLGVALQLLLQSPVSSLALDVKINYLEVSELDQLEPCHCSGCPDTSRNFHQLPHPPPSPSTITITHHHHPPIETRLEA